MKSRCRAQVRQTSSPVKSQYKGTSQWQMQDARFRPSAVHCSLAKLQHRERAEGVFIAIGEVRLFFELLRNRSLYQKSMREMGIVRRSSGQTEKNKKEFLILQHFP